MGGLLPLADARQKAAEAYQHTSERHPAEHLRGHWKTRALKGDLSGWWSRRIDDTHRIVYKEQDGNIIIASCFGHYSDT